MSDKEQVTMTLEQAIGVIRANINCHSLDIWRLRDAERVVLDQLDRQRRALEFYASQWRHDVYCGPTELLLYDGGDQARAALAQGNSGTDTEGSERT